MSEQAVFEYSRCLICGRHISRCIGASKPVWFHTPMAEHAQPEHKPLPAEVTSDIGDSIEQTVTP